MTLAFLLFGAAFATIAAGTVWLVLAPLGRSRLAFGLNEQLGEERTALLRRDASLQALRDLEEDLAQSRVTPADYRLLRERYMLEALVALKETESTAQDEVAS